jgi:hypothetical protein
MTKVRFIFAGFLMPVILCACGKSGTDSSGSAGDSEKEEHYSKDEKPFVAAAQPFMAALVKQDHAAAYALLSSHAKAAMTLEQFTAANNKSFTELGTPISLGDIYGIETDKDVLAGPDHVTGADNVEKGVNRLLAFDAVGTMPDSIPAAIRRASIKGDIVFGKEKEGDELSYIVTVVLVDDGGKLRVGHYWFRNRTMLD